MTLRFSRRQVWARAVVAEQRYETAYVLPRHMFQRERKRRVAIDNLPLHVSNQMQTSQAGSIHPNGNRVAAVIVSNQIKRAAGCQSDHTGARPRIKRGRP